MKYNYIIPYCLSAEYRRNICTLEQSTEENIQFWERGKFKDIETELKTRGGNGKYIQKCGQETSREVAVLEK
jgi:hypothetical protein